MGVAFTLVTMSADLKADCSLRLVSTQQDMRSMGILMDG